MLKLDNDKIRSVFSDPSPPEEFLCTHITKEVYFHFQLKLYLFAFSVRMGQHEKQLCHQMRCKGTISSHHLWSVSQIALNAGAENSVISLVISLKQARPH